MRVILTAAILFASSFGALAQYDTSGRLKWTWDGSFEPTVRSNINQDYPSQAQANAAYRSLRDDNPDQTIDFAALPGARKAYGVYLFACKRGSYDPARHIVQDDEGWVHCMTHFVTADGKTLYKRPVNFIQQNRERWDIQLPTTGRVLQVIEAPKRRSLFGHSDR